MNDHPDDSGKEMPRPSVRYVDATEGDVGQRLDNFLLRVFKTVPKSHVYRVLRKGEVRVNGKRAKPETRIALGDRVRIPPIRVETTPQHSKPSASLQNFISTAIIHEDRDLLIINKPSGLAVHGGSGLAFGVIEALRAARPSSLNWNWYTGWIVIPAAYCCWLNGV